MHKWSTMYICPAGHYCLNATIVPKQCGLGFYTKPGQSVCQVKHSYIGGSSLRNHSLLSKYIVCFICFLNIQDWTANDVSKSHRKKLESSQSPDQGIYEIWDISDTCWHSILSLQRCKSSLRIKKRRNNDLNFSYFLNCASFKIPRVDMRESFHIFSQTKILY